MTEQEKISNDFKKISESFIYHVSGIENVFNKPWLKDCVKSAIKKELPEIDKNRINSYIDNMFLESER